MITRALIAGISLVSFAVGSGVLAQSNPEPTPDQDPTGSTGALKGNVTTGCGYNAHNGNGTRSVTDLHVPGALGDYGLDFTRHWNSLPPGANDPHNWASIGFSDFGASGWSHSWAWSADVTKEYPKELASCDCTDHYMITWITISFPDGREIKYKLVRSEIFQFGIPARPWFGPPYLSDELDWQIPGDGVHDLLESMAPDGSEFWLHLADGGSVHFVGDSWSGDPAHKDWSYQAKQVYDPHGFRTDLNYDPVSTGQVTEIRPEAGRWLKLTWGYCINGSMAQVIRRVEIGDIPGGPAVNYTYAVTGNALTLRTADYGAGSDPATYVYQNSFLMEANDPHFAGAMTRIRYKYRMDRCQVHPAMDPPNAHFDYIYAQPEAVAEEQSPYNANGFPIFVSRFGIGCWDGTRTEWNGFGGSRKFYYGHSATWTGSGSRGNELAKVTDFAITGTNAADARQSHRNGKIYQVWDGRNTMTQFAFNDSNGQPNEIRHSGSDNSFQTYNWTSPGNSAQRDPLRIHNPHPHWLFSKTDERFQTTTYTRDSRRRITRIDYQGGSAETFQYNDFNQIVHHQLPSGAVQNYEYDASHRLQFEYNSWDYPSSPLDYTEYAYYGPGDHPEWTDLVKTKTEGLARARGAPFTVRMTYNGLQQQIATVEYASTTGQYSIVRYGYDPYGNCTSVTDELGHAKIYTFDIYRRCISYEEPLNAPDWNGGPLVGTRRWDWIYDRWTVNVGWFDPMSHTGKDWRIQIEPIFNAEGHRRMSARAHDEQGRVAYEWTGWYMDSAGTWVRGADEEQHSFTYDENGQKKTYTDPRARVTTYDYDLRNRLWKTNETVNSLPRTTETLYDAVGNKTLVKFPVEGGVQRTQQWLDYNAFGQPGRFIDERGNTTNMDYWNWGPMKKLAHVVTHRSRDGGGIEDQQTTFNYDGMGRPQWTIFPDGSSELTTYLYGQMDAFKTRKDQTKRVHYDTRGREDYHAWDGNAAPRIDRTWDNANRLITISNSVATLDYQYDDAGQANYEGTTIAGSGNYTHVNYLRYQDGTVSHMQYPNGLWLRHDYTARGQLKRIYQNWGNVWNVPIEYTYLTDGKMSYKNHGSGVQTLLDYDGRGFPSMVRNFIPSTGQELTRRNYYRDTRDRITAFQKGSGNPTNPMEDGRGDHYWYDAEGQLTDAYYGAVDPVNNPNNPVRVDYFPYDQLGNRFGSNFLAPRGWTNFSRKDNGLNQYLQWYSVVKYDDDIAGWGSAQHANGVMMMDGNITAGYNALNQPMMIWSANNPGGNWLWFGFDPLGRCVKRWYAQPDGSAPGAATYFVYDGWNLVQEGYSPWSPTRFYIHGGSVDEIVQSYNSGTGLLAYHYYDASGHCTLLSDGQGNIKEQYYYDAFGYPYFYNNAGNWLGSSPHGNRFLFTGREWLSDLKVYDFRNRLYQPELGRFLQPDPKEFAAGDYNLYRYCHNDPVNKSDPMGLEAIWDRIMAWQSGRPGGISEQLTEKRIFAALDQAAGWAQRHHKEVAGTMNTRGQIIEGPVEGRQLRSSDPGPITNDTRAIWHIHLMLKPNPYIFSRWPNGSDNISLMKHPTVSHYVGVLNAPPGQFTIFAQTPEMKYQHTVRFGPERWPPPTEE